MRSGPGAPAGSPGACSDTVSHPSQDSATRTKAVQPPSRDESRPYHSPMRWGKEPPGGDHGSSGLDGAKRSMNSFRRSYASIGIHSGRADRTPAMSDPVPISAHLVDLLDESGILILEETEHPKDPAVLGLLTRLIEDPDHQGTILSFRSSSISPRWSRGPAPERSDSNAEKRIRMAKSSRCSKQNSDVFDDGVGTRGPSASHPCRAHRPRAGRSNVSRRSGRIAFKCRLVVSYHLQASSSVIIRADSGMRTRRNLY